jgi:hypothetical protein
MLNPHAMFIAAIISAIIGAGIVIVGAWWMVMDYIVGSRQKKQFVRVKDAKAVSCQVRDVQPVFLGRLRSFRGAQVAQVTVEKAGAKVQLKRPLILGRNWEPAKDTLGRLSVGANLDLLEDERGIVALRVD